MSSARPCLRWSHQQGGIHQEAEAMLITGPKGWAEGAQGFCRRHSIFHVDELDPLSSENTQRANCQHYAQEFCPEQNDL